MNGNPWVENLFRPLVIGMMLGCIALSLVGLVHLFFPAWNGTYLVVGCVLAALEANYSYRLIQVRQLRGTDVLRFRVVEVMMFFILLKIGSYAGDRWADVLADIQTWPRQPWNILDPETTFAFALAFFSWLVSTQTANDLERISDPHQLYRAYIPPIESLTGRFFWGGAVLLIAAGINRIGIAALLNLNRPPVPGLVLNVLVYFLSGLVMLGQVHFTRLRQQWQAQEIKVAEELPGRWARYSLAFIGLAALLAFLLPTGYTVGLLDAGAVIVYVLLYIATLIVKILLFVLFLLLTPLVMLFGIERPILRQAILPPLQPPLQQSSSAVLGWFEMVRSLLFWAAALGMVFYVVRSYLRDHPELLQVFMQGPIRTLCDFLIALWRRLVGLAEAASERIPRRLSLQWARLGLSEAPFRFFRLGALSPHERILYYYLSILRRAERQGFPRHRAQTPYEYSMTLAPHLAQGQQEMDLLTHAFVEARYSQHIIEPGQAKRVRYDWQEVKAALQALKRKRKPSR